MKNQVVLNALIGLIAQVICLGLAMHVHADEINWAPAQALVNQWNAQPAPNTQTQPWVEQGIPRAQQTQPNLMPHEPICTTQFVSGQYVTTCN